MGNCHLQLLRAACSILPLSTVVWNTLLLLRWFSFVFYHLLRSISMPRECKSHPDKICSVCCIFSTKTQWQTITTNLKKIYKLYFGCHLGDQDKLLTRHQICSACWNGLCDWIKKKKASMPFFIPKRSSWRLLFL